MEAFSQDFQLIHKSDNFAPFYIIISENSVIDEVTQKIEPEAKASKSSYLIVNGTNINSETIKDSINDILNSELEIGKRNVYLIIIGNGDFFNVHDKFTNDFFPSMCFVQTDKEKCNYTDYYHQYYDKINFDLIYSTLKKEDLWEIDLDTIKKNYRSNYYLSKAEYGLGLGLSLTKPIGLRNENKLPGSYLSYDIYGYRRMSKQWKIFGNFTFGFKNPNVKKIMQEEIKGQIDYSSMTSGDDVSVTIDKEIEGWSFFSGSIESRRYVSIPSKLKPFFGIGISYTYFKSMCSHIDTTFMMNSSDMSGPDDIDDINIDRENSIMDQSKFNHFGMILSTGFDYPLSDIVLFNFRTTYNLSLNSFNTNISTFNNLNFHIGLTFRLQGNRHSFYEYIRLK